MPAPQNLFFPPLAPGVKSILSHRQRLCESPGCSPMVLLKSGFGGMAFGEAERHSTNFFLARRRRGVTLVQNLSKLSFEKQFSDFKKTLEPLLHGRLACAIMD